MKHHDASIFKHFIRSKFVLLFVILPIFWYYFFILIFFIIYFILIFSQIHFVKLDNVGPVLLTLRV